VPKVLKPENLRTPRSTEEARELGRKGGIKSGQVRKEKKLMSMLYAELLSEKYKITDEDGNAVTIDGDKYMKDVVVKVLGRADSSSVSMMKEIREATEGSNVNLKGVIADVDTSKLSKEKQETLLDAVVELIYVKE